MASLCAFIGAKFIYFRAKAVIIIQLSLISMPGQDGGEREPQTLLSQKSFSMGPLNRPLGSKDSPRSSRENFLEKGSSLQPQSRLIHQTVNGAFFTLPTFAMVPPLA